MILKPPEFIRPIYGHPLGPGKGLVAGYPFNEGSGKIVQDLSGSELVGTEQINFVWQAGKYGAARYFNWDGCIAINNGAVVGEILDLTNNFTIVIGFTTGNPATISYDTLLGKRNAAGYQFQFRLKDSKLNFLASGGAVAASTILVAKQSYQGIVRYIDGNVEIYLDGKLDCTPTAKAINHVNTDVSIGCTYHVNRHWWYGLIEYMLIYNRVLSAVEMVQLEEPYCMYERDM